MRALDITGEGCVEKADMVRKLAQAPGIEVAEELVVSERPKRLLYEAKELISLELPLLRSLVERHRVPHVFFNESSATEEQERAAALKSFAEAGWIRSRTPRQEVVPPVKLTAELKVAPPVELTAELKERLPTGSCATPASASSSNDVAETPFAAQVHASPIPARPSLPRPAVRRPQARERPTSNIVARDR